MALNEKDNARPCQRCGMDVEDGVCSGCQRPPEGCICAPDDQVE